MRVSKAAIKHLYMSAISGVEYFKTHVAVSISRKKDVYTLQSKILIQFHNSNVNTF